MLTISIIVMVLTVMWCSIMIIRINKVFNYRAKLRNTVFNMAKRDIENGREWEWRWTCYDSVSFDTMVNKFWKPLDSFYKDKTFIL